MAPTPQKTECKSPEKDLAIWLQDNPLGSLSKADQRLVARSAKFCQFSRGETIYNEGENRKFVYLLVSGIAIQKRGEVLGSSISINIVRPKQILGLLSFESDCPYLLTTKALSEVSTIRIPVQTMRSVWESSPDLVRQVSRMLMEHLTDAYQTISHSSYSRADKRILSTLINISEQASLESNIRCISFPVTRREIAELSHTTVETAIRVLKIWEKNGWVVTKKKKITLTCLECLQSSVNMHSHQIESVTRS
ncbi:MAG: Crp/Fnr family transcriptional regulator [Armatimonadetes bacterium]|nr:Crp/Fnr family transcriptional regulator [Armatimonadota bacterium]